jgi:hypothetical protein
MLRIALVSLITAMSGTQQPAQPQLPPGHPQPGQMPAGHPEVGGLPAGHPDVMELENADVPVPPEANPADVESLDGIIKAYYETLSGPKGQARDWDRLRSLFQPMAGLVAARPVGDHNAGMWVMKLEEFIAFNKAVLEKGGYFEREIHREVQAFGNIAHVWSTYESRRPTEDTEPYSRGIYSIQLLKDGPRWWIVNVYWDYERPNAPIPGAYLPE